MGLWTQADREGRLEDRPMRLKASLFPYDEHTHNKQRRGAAGGKGHQFGFGDGGSSGISMERYCAIAAQRLSQVALDLFQAEPVA